MVDNAPRIKVLHVDDDSEFAELTATFLETENDRFSVETVHSADEALELLTDMKFDCIISDYDMPKQNGLEFLEAVRQQFPDHPDPFILFTGEGSESVAAEALNSGATSYVQKGSLKQTIGYLAERIKYDIRTTRAKRDQDRFSTLVSALEDPVYILNEEGAFTFVNDAFVELVGYDRDTILGSDPSLVKSPETVQTAEERLASLLSESGPDSAKFEVEIQRKEADPVPCEDHMGVLPYASEEFRGSIGVLRDISEQKKRERQLVNEKSRYERLVDQNLAGLYIVRGSELIYHNDRFAELFDYPAEQGALNGEQLSEFIAAEDQDRLSENLYKVQQGNLESIRRRYVGLTAEKNNIDIVLLARGIELDQEPAVIGTVLDIGEDETAYWELRRERDRLNEFTSVISHDLRGPLSVAGGHLELLARDTDLDPEAAKTLEKATNAIDRVEELLEDLLQLAQQGDVVDEKEAVGLREIAESTWEYVETETAELETTAGGTIQADPIRLKGLFENLYRNAIEHGGSNVTVTVGRLDDGFYIEDDGAGIPEAYQETVFEVGYSTDEEGTGFGLSIVKQIAEAHEWEIRATDGTNDGARFEITGV